MTREEKGGVAIGGIIGLLAWLFDNRYIIVGGTKDSPLSNFIYSILPIDAVCKISIVGVSDICGYFATLLVLTFTGIAIGYFFVKIEKFIKHIASR